MLAKFVQPGIRDPDRGARDTDGGDHHARLVIDRAGNAADARGEFLVIDRIAPGARPLDLIDQRAAGGQGARA